MYKSTFRTPTFNDLYYYRLGNRSLRPEKAKEYNIGVNVGGQKELCMGLFDIYRRCVL